MFKKILLYSPIVLLAGVPVAHSSFGPPASASGWLGMLGLLMGAAVLFQGICYALYRRRLKVRIPPNSRLTRERRP